MSLTALVSVVRHIKPSMVSACVSYLQCITFMCHITLLQLTSCHIWITCTWADFLIRWRGGWLLAWHLRQRLPNKRPLFQIASTTQNPLQPDSERVSSCVYGDKFRCFRATQDLFLTDPNWVYFVPKPNQALGKVLSLYIHLCIQYIIKWAFRHIWRNGMFQFRHYFVVAVLWVSF